MESLKLAFTPQSVFLKAIKEKNWEKYLQSISKVPGSMLTDNDSKLLSQLLLSKHDSLISYALDIA